MGWMRTILLGDIGNRMDIADAEDQITALKSQQSLARKSLQRKDLAIESLSEEVGRQKLAIQALTRFLMTKNLIDQNELDEFIHEVDAEDGVIDGQMRVMPEKGRLIFDRKKAISPGQFKKVDERNP